MVKFINCSPKEYGMLNQVFRSGTAIGALVSEAVYAQSPADFVNKLSIALKECNETLYWLNIAQQILSISFRLPSRSAMRPFIG